MPCVSPEIPQLHVRLFVPKLNLCTYKQSGLDVSIRMKIIEKALE